MLHLPRASKKGKYHEKYISQAQRWTTKAGPSMADGHDQRLGKASPFMMGKVVTILAPLSTNVAKWYKMNSSRRVNIQNLGERDK